MARFSIEVFYKGKTITKGEIEEDKENMPGPWYSTDLEGLPIQIEIILQDKEG